MILKCERAWLSGLHWSSKAGRVGQLGRASTGHLAGWWLTPGERSGQTPTEASTFNQAVPLLWNYWHKYTKIFTTAVEAAKMTVTMGFKHYTTEHSYHGIPGAVSKNHGTDEQVEPFAQATQQQRGEGHWPGAKGLQAALRDEDQRVGWCKKRQRWVGGRHQKCLWEEARKQPRMFY